MYSKYKDMFNIKMCGITYMTKLENLSIEKYSYSE